MEAVPILFIIGLALGVGAGYWVRQLVAKRQTESAETKAQELIQEAKNKQKEILLEAKDKSLKLIEDAKKEDTERRKEHEQQLRRLENRESMFDKKLMEFEDKQSKLHEREKQIEKLKEELHEIKEQGLVKLQKIAEMTKDEAAEALMKNVETNVKDDLMSRIRKLEKESQEEYEKKARHMIAAAMERCAHSLAVETTTTSVTLPSDEMKGRVIGKEGRNIKAIEQLTGTEIIVDDTPETIFISGYSPIRRHIARIALEKLLLDGRIHPGRIEEAVETAKKELARDIRQAGEEAAYELRVVGLDPKLIQILGRLKYRTSYGHNVLQHSKEVAILAGLIAEELGANVALCRKGGLLHDIGKALDHEIQGGHPEIGYDIMKKFGMPEELAYISIGHHEDSPRTLEAVIVKVADSISGARPGARKDTYEQYVQRLDELEQVANSFAGVEKVYAIYAGREVRVFVEPAKMDDYAAKKLAKEIAGKIEQELKYPGEIKVTVIREQRIIEYAR
jgi:ribonuclease Y